MKGCQFNLVNQTSVPLDDEPLRRCAEIFCAGECPEGNCEINLIICNDTSIRRLNRQYRGDDSITDVLTFSLPEETQVPFTPEIRIHPRDIVIDINQLDRQKGTNKLEDELMEVFIHGLLHAFGYDHIRREDRKLMIEKEMKYKQIMDGTK